MNGSKAFARAQDTTVSNRSELQLDVLQPVLSEDVFRDVFQNASDSMIISDPQGQIIRVNAETERLFGYPESELIGQSVDLLVPDSSWGDHKQNRTNYMEKPRHCASGTGVDVVGLRKDGSSVLLEISLNPLPMDPPLVVSNIRDMSDRKFAEKMRRDLSFESTLAKLSALFINLPTDSVDQEITNGIRLLCEALDADRGSMGRLDEAGVLVEHSWARPGFPVFPDRRVANTLPWLCERVLRGEISFAEHPQDLPPEASLERAYMESIGIKSSLVVPFRIAGEVAGFLSSDSFRNFQKWDADIIARFQLAAEILANALAREKANEEIRRLKEQLLRENAYLQQEIKLEHSHSAITGNSAPIQAVLRKIEQVACTPSSVLILGETGTGKELVARTIHELSHCKDHPMVKTNCAALPASLIESELFGREKGAYTGAMAKEIGRFELANGSTVFLDEIGELPLELQPKLLRVLQEGEFERLGSSKTIRVNVRVIAATSRDLKAMVKEGKFREDLYYRLNVFPIVVPPLRERLDDLPMLVRHILNDLSGRMGKTITSIQQSTVDAFQNYHWPGNIRELRNVIERSLILNSGSSFQADLSELGPSAVQNQRLSVLEGDHIRHVLQTTQWRIRGNNGAAHILGLKPTTLEARMKKLGIRRPV